ncbi:SigB/SigF/SigG family RNA polymerase sigma factor [Streptomyces europaeiscabiei]|uniref:SigB/SigF/SigG family RNA polymerase sigma factor n=1 Tax=Streptomyces europaeiscabiei TaxID=146819 RepID=A0ABU4NDG7_9ACTN|nr:SigB/SigF/SigG family RNA polymerase sigma factor [Streptomyces europaeiscabiei]MDX2526078.1 SigB/SigF/SigG family RNA polymerase sigma factor [Streptomyces europaeiscabiei]MDX2759620.1 SigB/SigF/SigG family RNA polymerase sigma factor [Streptomyces europaeiscabiei]MDX2771661.1 SigB/SigF/SigG family RNA polymerase sigma factor [Streptomyces europaeiscabiei]MDX3543421.1 SigB/SigF/SigG family RNA polymerase sigma factor [Streptomyces europaeiscabiei]MDX3553237.1 SigB/SigF/SigG family RNA poly
MRNGDGPVRDEERGTRELPAEDDGGPSGPAHLADGVDGIPEQARPHPEDESSAAAGASRRTEPADGEEREASSDGQRDPEGALRNTTSSRGRTGASPALAQSRAEGTVTAGGTMSEHERHDEAGAQNAQTVRSTQHNPQDRSGARALFVELRALPDGSVEYAELRNRLVRMHLPLVEHLARRFRNRGEPLDDLTQVATIGLIKSVDRFDPDRGVEFSTYATPTVVGEIKRHFRDKGWAVRVPRRLQELRLSLTTATAELSQQHGRSPTVHELAEKLGISEEEVLEGLESANAYSTLSLDVPDTDDESPAVADTLGSEDEALEGVEYRESLKPLLEDLPPREKRILLLRFFGNMTQSQIAQEVGISQMHVSRLLARTLAQLREKLLVEE